ncbi:MAG: hypothetical protein DRJ13_12635 [Bacteroidetes bacterium]|nr:MAG: hypothetical protein DRJ13_12635 [Bacteroidota bacterium]
MESPDPALRGLAAWTAGLFDCKTTGRLLKRLENDQATLTFYFDGTLEEITVTQLRTRKTISCRFGLNMKCENGDPHISFMDSE